MIAELVEREEATANHEHGKQTSIVFTPDAGIDPTESEFSLGVEDEIRHKSTQLTSPVNELFMASNAETQTPMVWNFKGTQTNPRVWTRGTNAIFLNLKLAEVELMLLNNCIDCLSWNIH